MHDVVEPACPRAWPVVPVTVSVGVARCMCMWPVVIAYVHTTAGAAAGSRSMCGQQAPPRPIARQLLLHVGRSMLDLERECMTAIGYVGPCASLAV